MNRSRGLKQNSRYDVDQSLGLAKTNATNTNGFSGSTGRSNSRQPRSKVNSRARAPINTPSQTDLLIKDLMLEFITKSAEIAEFHINHKKAQKKYENRMINRELNLIAKDIEFNGSFLPNSNLIFRFLSRILNKFLALDENGILTIYSFDCKDRKVFSVTNFFEKDNTIIAAYLLENDSFGECKLLLLCSNFNFCYIDLIRLENEMEGKNAFELLYDAKSPYFNLKPYLNLPEASEYNPGNAHEIKIISEPIDVENYKGDVIINFSQIASCIVVFNIKSFCVIENFVIKPEDILNVDVKVIDLIKRFIEMFFEKYWSLKEFEYLQQLTKEINQDKNNFDNFKKLVILLMSDEVNDDPYPYVFNLKNFEFIKRTHAAEKTEKRNKVFHDVIETLLIKNFDDFTSRTINIYNVLNKVVGFFEKIHSCSVASKKNDMSLIGGKFRVYQKIFLQCFKRGISLEKICKTNDPENKGYLPKGKIVQILKNLPIGITNKDIDEFLSIFNLFDDNNNYMYSHLFLLEEDQINGLLYRSSKKHIDNKNTCGYFSLTAFNLNIDEESKKIRRKQSFEFEYVDEISGDDNLPKRTSSKRNLHTPSKNDLIVENIIHSCLHNVVTQVVFVQHLNLFFAISPNYKNISIFTTDTQKSTKQKMLKKVGIINIDSYTDVSPGFLYYIEEKNLLITQQIHKTSCDLVIIDVYKEILPNIKSTNFLNVTPNRKGIVHNVISSATNDVNNSINIENNHLIGFNYLERNELFVLSSKYEVVIINPKAAQYELAYQIQTKTNDIFTKVCKNICEYPSEKTGDEPFKKVKEFKLLSPLDMVFNFSFGNGKKGNETNKKFFASDWIILLDENNEIFSYCVSQLFIKQKAKEVDSPIPKGDIQNLFKLCYREMMKSMKLYKQTYSKDILSYYQMVKEADNQRLQEIAMKIKEIILYSTDFQLKPSQTNVITIHELIHLIKSLNLQFEQSTLTSMFPQVTVEQITANQNADYFKTELYPADEIRDTNNETQNLPKREKKLESDINTLQTFVSPIDSGIKKIVKFCVDKGFKPEALFKKIDLENEEILDESQFFEGCENVGLLVNDYLSPTELRSLFKKMDKNSAGSVTNTEFKDYFDKKDYDTIAAKVRREREARISDETLDYTDIMNFVIGNEEVKVSMINNVINEINEYYLPLGSRKVTVEDISPLISKVQEKVALKDFDLVFDGEVVFADDFEKFIKYFEVKLDTDEIQKIFYYFDQGNKNLFFYSKDFRGFLKEQSGSIITKPGEFHSKIDKNKFILVWLAVMKKLIKYCIMNLELNLNEFTEKFILLKKVNKNTVVLDCIPTKMLIEKINSELKFNSLEQKLFNLYYLDLFNFGLLFKVDLKKKFDNLMKYIHETNAFDFSTFDTFDESQRMAYLNTTKQKLEAQNKLFDDDAILNTLEIFDNLILQFLSQSGRMGMKDFDKLNEFIKSFDSNKDSFLSPVEFDQLLKALLPKKIYTLSLSQSLNNQLCEYITFLNEPTRQFISINRLLLFLLYSFKRYEVFKPVISNTNLEYGNEEMMTKKISSCITTLNSYDSLGMEIESYSSDYLKLMKEGIFSGLIILNKFSISQNFIFELMKKTHMIDDYINFYKRIASQILYDNFNTRMKGIAGREILEEKENEVDYSKIEIPKIRINIVDTREMLFRKKFECEMVENFDFYHQELGTVVNITKLRKSFLLREVSQDGQNLLNHIESSLKINQYLQKEFFASNNSKDDFPFIRNFGIFTKEIIIDKKLEEEFYIINEKIDMNEYISLYELVKNNGGLLQIPELANTDLAFYILRFWGMKILNILAQMHKMNICFRYFTLKDFYVSKDGKRIKMRNLFNYSFTSLRGEFFSGPDLSKIFLLLDQIPHSQLETLPDEKLDEIYDDAYLAPEFLLYTAKAQTNKIDTWLFGICMFNLLFGFTPISFYSQIRKWCNTTNLLFEKAINKFPYDIISQHFFYNPFENINDIVEDELYFTKVLKMKSFSAIVKTKYLNLSTENNESLNGLGIVLDLVNTCLAIDSVNRPDIIALSRCDLFQFDQYELILCNKFLDNVLNYFSPEIIIEQKMLYPLREICADIMKNEQANPYEINNYENFIFQTIRDINTFLFRRDYAQPTTSNSAKANEVDDDIYEESKDNGDNIFVKNPEYYFKNSMIVKSIIDNKIFDLLIFLTLRHFTINLSLFKVDFQKSLREQIKQNSQILDEAQASKLSAMKRANYKTEMSHVCGRLIRALCDLLSNCVTAMTSYDHMLTLYVENILVYIIKLFIGEENMLLSEICDMKNSNDELNKYLIHRTFLRDDKIVTQKKYKEDEADKVFSILSSNKELNEIKSLWCPELYDFTIDLFKEAFGENCSGNFRHIVIKNYFSTVNEIVKNIANQLENPLIDNKIKDYLSIINTNNQMKVGYRFINTDYVSEILSLAECSMNVRAGFISNDDPHKNLVNKRNALRYICTLFKGKNEYKVRACFDFKVHFFVQGFLFTNGNDYLIKKEVLNIFKEISLNLTDINEISWLFGNNYDTVFNERYKMKSDSIKIEESVDNVEWDSNFCLIDFMNKLLNKPHSFILYFTDRFLGINLHNKNSTVIQIMKEFGLIFSSPLCLKPLMRALQNPKENIYLRQICLDVLVNLLLSNNQKIISHFNMTMCNFYEVVTSAIQTCLTLPPHLKPEVEEQNDAVSKAKEHFKNNIRQIVRIIIELQNPYIKTQMFSCPSMVKYMEQNKLSYVPRLDIAEIEAELVKCNTVLKFNGLEGDIIFLINAFKSWVLNLEKDKIPESKNRIKNVMNSISHVFNNEWSEGIKSEQKNCLIFNIVKLYEWLMKKEYHEFLFPYDDESETTSTIINFLTKIRETNVNMKLLIGKVKKMNVSKGKKNSNFFGDSYYTLQKIYNFIAIKMLNIISIIFGKNDDYYNSVFSKVKFGAVFAHLLKVQYEIMSMFLGEDNIDISILDNYTVENRVRIAIVENLLNLSSKFDEIKLQFLQSEFIKFLFDCLIYDFRKFRTQYKKISLDFLVYKNSFPLRSEGIAIINLIVKKYNNPNTKTEIDSFIYDELIRNIKIVHLIQNELAMIKNKIKGDEVLSVMSLFNLILSHKDQEIIKMMDLENAKDYFIYAIQKDTSIKRTYPMIVEYINKAKLGLTMKN